jgi:hypothetical protein
MDIEDAITKIQPYYTEYFSQFSKAYKSGSEYYVGENLLDWWNINIRFIHKNITKLSQIIELLIRYRDVHLLFEKHII